MLGRASFADYRLVRRHLADMVVAGGLDAGCGLFFHGSLPSAFEELQAMQALVAWTICFLGGF